jgi:hypothetical protein
MPAALFAKRSYRTESPTISKVAHVGGQLLNEQRHAIGSFHDLLGNVL